jgi:hypothetical protein
MTGSSPTGRSASIGQRTVRRKTLLLATASGIVAAGLGARSASAATDDELAYANFGLAAAYLAADYYARALEADQLGADVRRTFRSGQSASLAHARAISDLITGAGDTPATSDDFAFEWPAKAFETAAAVRKTGLDVLRPTLGAYQSAVAGVSESSYRVLFASLVASLGQQIGALVGPVGERVEPFPPALELETASAALEGYLG